VIVGDCCGCGSGVSRYLDKNDNFARHITLLVELSEIFQKCTQKYFFEKRTQSYQTLKMYFEQKKHQLFATQLSLSYKKQHQLCGTSHVTFTG
jgi:hypothetical protein